MKPGALLVPRGDVADRRRRPGRGRSPACGRRGCRRRCRCRTARAAGRLPRRSLPCGPPGTVTADTIREAAIVRAAMPPIPLDLVHSDEPVHQTVAAFLLPDVATLIDCGAAANLPSLEAELARHGMAIEDLDHLLLTHIHLDHAGAAGALAARNPRLQVWVHRVGARHLIDPSRLIASTASVYGARLRAGLGPDPAGAGRARARDRRRDAAAGRRRAAGRADAGARAAPDRVPDRRRHALRRRCGRRRAGRPRRATPSPPARRPTPTRPPGAAPSRASRELAPERLAIAHYGVIDDVPRHMAALERAARHLAEPHRPDARTSSPPPRTRPTGPRTCDPAPPAAVLGLRVDRALVPRGPAPLRGERAEAQARATARTSAAARQLLPRRRAPGERQDLRVVARRRAVPVPLVGRRHHQRAGRELDRRRPRRCRPAPCRRRRRASARRGAGASS